MEVLCQNADEFSSALTAIVMPAGHDADKLRETILTHFDMSLGMGLSKLKGKVFRIGHLGDFNDLTLAGALAGVEMGFTLAGVPHKAGGMLAALEYLGKEAGKRSAQRRAA
jgi:alanine-glyoxylate transaminase/serine-glyoxylate transaminase/serine-pyruvate transaminase